MTSNMKKLLCMIAFAAVDVPQCFGMKFTKSVCLDEEEEGPRRPQPLDEVAVDVPQCFGMKFTKSIEHPEDDEEELPEAPRIVLPPNFVPSSTCEEEEDPCRLQPEQPRRRRVAEDAQADQADVVTNTSNSTSEKEESRGCFAALCCRRRQSSTTTSTSKAEESPRRHGGILRAFSPPIGSFLSQLAAGTMRRLRSLLSWPASWFGWPSTRGQTTNATSTGGQTTNATSTGGETTNATSTGGETTNAKPSFLTSEEEEGPRRPQPLDVEDDEGPRRPM